ncbi:MAG: response regulator [Geobacteraceae bacterium]
MKTKKKILLADDVELFLEMEKSFFKREGFDLLVARSGEEALSIIRDEHPDMVYMDLFMPDMDGDECCRAVKADNNLRHIPVIMVTSGERNDDFERCWKAGCDEVLAKPINRNLFLAIARKFLHVKDRVYPRFIVRLSIHHGTSSGELLTNYSVNLSTGGLFLETTRLLPPDTPLHIEFILPESDKRISCSARVAWLNHPEMMKNPNLPVGIGLHFIDLTLSDLDALRKYLQEGSMEPFC